MKWVIIPIIVFIAVTGFIFRDSLHLPTNKRPSIKTISITPTAPPMRSTNIQVDSPQQYEKIPNIVAIKGQARVFENVVSIRIKNKNTGKVLIQDTVYVDSPDVGKFGPFTYIVNLSDKKLSKGTPIQVEVYQASPKDGSEIDKITIYLTYSP